MNIIRSSKEYSEKLETFKGLVWPVADTEHYDKDIHFFKEEFTLIATETDTIIGYITVVVDTGVAHLEPLMVTPERIGQGIGSALLATAEEKAKSLGAHKIWLETGSTWKAKKFYEKHGYTVRTVLPQHHGNQDFVLMDKML